MLALFFGGTKVAALDAMDKKKLSKVLDKMDAFIQRKIVETGSSFGGESSSTLYRSDESKTWRSATHFLAHVETEIEVLKACTKPCEKFIAVNIGTDFTEWKKEEIQDFKHLFLAFKDLPIRINLDAKQMAAIDDKRFIEFISTMRFAKNIESIMLSRPNSSNHEELPLSAIRLKFINQVLPKSLIAIGSFLELNNRSTTLKLIYAEKKGTLSITATPRKDIEETRKEEKSTALEGAQKTEKSQSSMLMGAR